MHFQHNVDVMGWTVIIRLCFAAKDRGATMFLSFHLMEFWVPLVCLMFRLRAIRNNDFILAFNEVSGKTV